MLARIIHHKQLAGTRMATVSIGAGALGDALAWCLLAAVLSSVDAKPSAALANIGGGALFLLFAATLVRPVLNRLTSRLVVNNQLTEGAFVFCLALMALGAFVTDAVGLHAVFGAFVVGTVLPRGVLTSHAIARIEPLTVALLMPLFFTFSGLNTKIGLLNSVGEWLMCAVVLSVAVLSKAVACWLAARSTGIPTREAMGIGILMNARGMMELIIINIGRERGLISDELFAMLVLMAIVTTLMTSPLFDLVFASITTIPASRSHDRSS